MKPSFHMGCAALCASMVLTGCGNFDAMPDLTKEQTALIAEVSAGLLVQTDKNAATLAKDFQIVAHDERERTRKANLEKLLAQKAESQASDAAGNGGSMGAGTGEGEKETAFPGIAQFCRQEHFDIQYTGSYMTTSYPENADPEDALFNISADGTNQLIILQFTAVNLTGEEQVLDLFDSGVSFKLSTGGNVKSVLATLLPDDMSMYEGRIPAGESVNLVLIQELTRAEAENIDRITLTLEDTGGGKTSTILSSGMAAPPSDSVEDNDGSEPATEEADSESEADVSGSEAREEQISIS